MINSSLNIYVSSQVAELFRAFSDASRVRIISTIIDQEVNISAIAKLIGLSESAVSHHMRSLRQMRIVQARRVGKEVFYRVIDPHIIELFQQGVRHIQEEEVNKKDYL